MAAFDLCARRVYRFVDAANSLRFPSAPSPFLSFSFLSCTLSSPSVSLRLLFHVTLVLPLSLLPSSFPPSGPRPTRTYHARPSIRSSNLLCSLLFTVYYSKPLALQRRFELVAKTCVQNLLNIFFSSSVERDCG